MYYLQAFEAIVIKAFKSIVMYSMCMATSITLDDKHAEKLEEIADKNQRSMAGQVRHWINQHQGENSK